MAGLSIDDVDAPLYTIGQVASMLHVRVAFLRRLDEQSVVAPGRSAGGQRRYSRREIDRVAEVIKLTGEGRGITLSGARRALALQERVDQLEADLADARGRGRTYDSRRPGGARADISGQRAEWPCRQALSGIHLGRAGSGPDGRHAPPRVTSGDGDAGERRRSPQLDAGHRLAPGPDGHEVLAGVVPDTDAQPSRDPYAVPRQTAPPVGLYRRLLHRGQRNPYAAVSGRDLLPPRQADHQLGTVHQQPRHGLTSLREADAPPLPHSARAEAGTYAGCRA